LGNFIAEFLILLGAFKVSIAAAAFASAGFILATVYALWMIWQSFFGGQREVWDIKDYSAREMIPMALMIAVIVWIGIFPQTVVNTLGSSLKGLDRTNKTAIIGKACSQEEIIPAPYSGAQSLPVNRPVTGDKHGCP
jgi:NADH-quinone oxidoreductase subunit M